MIIESRQQLEAAIHRWAAAPTIAVDTETTGLNWKQDRIIGMSIAAGDSDAAFFSLPKPQDSLSLAKLLANPAIPKVFHNAKFDMHFLEKAGLPVGGLVYDTYILARLWDENRQGKKPYGLKPLAAELIGPETGETLEVLDRWLAENNLTKANMESVPREILGAYGANDPLITLQLYRILRQKLKTKGVPDEIIERRMMMLGVAYMMESKGVKLDLEHLQEYKGRLEAARDTLKADLVRMAGEGFDPDVAEATLNERDFNPQSADQLAAVMERLGWKPSKRTKTGKAQVDKFALKDWGHPFAKAMLEYRRAGTVLKSFVDGILKRQVDGVIHGGFNTFGARTGRWSSSDPNLQNVDKKSEARKAYIPRPGHVFLMADLKQIEPTLLAYFSKSEALIKAMVHGWDYHRFNASIALQVPYDKVTDEQRAKCKALGLAISYGAGAEKVAGMMGVSLVEAKRILDAYFKGLPDVKKFIKKTEADKVIQSACRAAEVKGRFVATKNGPMYDGKPVPWKYVPKHAGAPKLAVGEHPPHFTENDEWNDPNYWRFRHWDVIEERGVIEGPYGRKWELTCGDSYMAPNTKIQGTASDVLDECVEKCVKAGYLPLLQVHDELIFEIEEGKEQEAGRAIKAAMESVSARFKPVPIRVDLAVARKNWAEEAPLEV